MPSSAAVASIYSASKSYLCCNRRTTPQTRLPSWCQCLFAQSFQHMIRPHSFTWMSVGEDTTEHTGTMLVIIKHLGLSLLLSMVERVWSPNSSRWLWRKITELLMVQHRTKKTLLDFKHDNELTWKQRKTGETQKVMEQWSVPVATGVTVINIQLIISKLALTTHSMGIQHGSFISLCGYSTLWPMFF
jgi:hypothetical protein